MPKQYFELLGYKVRDAVTGLTGVVTSISFELYGCVQCLVHPGLDKDGKSLDLFWVDHKRLEKIGKKPVMAIPTFDAVAGGANLPSYSSLPSKR